MGSKGFFKHWRNDEDIPELWEDTSMFCVYTKLRIIASRPDWTVTSSWINLAQRVKMSVNTVRKAVAGLEKIGLVRSGATERGITQLTIVWGDWEPDLDAVAEENRPQGAPDELKAVSGHDAPGVSNFDTPEKGMSNFDTQDMSKCDTALNMYKQDNDKSKITTPPYNPPERLPFGFAEFWLAYPCKKGKQRAIKRWRRNGCRLEEILPVLGRQKRLRDWVKNDGRFVPRADAYLQRRGWEDDLPSDAKEEFYVLNFAEPKTPREVVARQWLEATAPELLTADNNKINSVFETERQDFEGIISLCGGDVLAAQRVMRIGWRKGCNSMRALREKTPGYLDDLRRGIKK